MRCALSNGFPSFLVGECVISLLDDIITIEDITDLEEESAANGNIWSKSRSVKWIRYRWK